MNQEVIEKFRSWDALGGKSTVRLVALVRNRCLCSFCGAGESGDSCKRINGIERRALALVSSDKLQLKTVSVMAMRRDSTAAKCRALFMIAQYMCDFVQASKNLHKHVVFIKCVSAEKILKVWIKRSSADKKVGSERWRAESAERMAWMKQQKENLRSLKIRPKTSMRCSSVVDERFFLLHDE